MVVILLKINGILNLFTMPNLYPYIDDALSLHIARWKNQLRCKSFSDLKKSSKLASKIEKFRDCKVVLTRYIDISQDEKLNVMVRAYVPPFWLSRRVYYRAFTKYEDDSWTRVMENELYESLCAQLEAIAPKT